MPQFSITRQVDLSATQAFAIAADVYAYKDFLPLLKCSTIRGPRTREGAVECFDADLQVGYDKLSLNETFTSHVIADHDKCTVTAISSDGPIKSLNAVWKISAVSERKTQVSFVVDYTLKNKLLQMMVGGLTSFAAEKIMVAFENRGRALYGAASS